MNRRHFLLLALSGLVTGCGFQLRGDTGRSNAAVYVHGKPEMAIVREMKRLLRGDRHMRLSDEVKSADAAAEILEDHNLKVILSLSGTGKVREYQLRYSVAYRIRDRYGEDLVSRSELTLVRDFSYDDTKVLAKEAEEALLLKDMHTDAAQQILRRIATLSLR